MLTPSEERRALDLAYVPEHIPGYVCSISQAEPHLTGDFLCYAGGESLVFIGYPLQSVFAPDALAEAVEAAAARFGTGQVVLVAPTIPAGRGIEPTGGRDHYYRLDLAALAHPPPKVSNMVRRASRDVRVGVTREMRPDHLHLIQEFLEARRPGEATRLICQRIPAYVAAVTTTRVFEARNREGVLVACDVAEFGAAAYAFYQFNFRSRIHYVPGASDLLLQEVIRAAREHGQRFLNLGLGISPGVARFKEKWGATPFLPYAEGRCRAGRRSLLDLLRRTL